MACRPLGPLLLLLWLPCPALPWPGPGPGPACPALPPACSCTGPPGALALTCSGLNSTAALATVVGVSSLRMSGGRLACLRTEHLAGLGLTRLAVTGTGLTQLLCPGSASLATLASLAELDLSNNSLTGLEEAALPPSLTSLELGGNPLACSPSLAWLHPWSAARPALLPQLAGLTCRVELSANQLAPLLAVTAAYNQRVFPSCPAPCSCHFYHFALTEANTPSYTVRVDCKARNLTAFPTLPRETTVLDLSTNQLGQAAYGELDVANMNYVNLESLSLSHNHLTAIDMKLFKLSKLHRAFEADHNYLTELPYDFSQLLQNLGTKRVTLSHNPWHCSCNAEITGSSLQRKIQDRGEVTCAEGSLPDSIVGRKLTEVDHALLCPPSEKVEQQELALKILCVVLAALIILILAKLLYDWYHYRHRGKLPWIVYRMP